MAQPAFAIDKQSPIPLYHQLHEHLKQLILDGNLGPHDRLPSENELAERHDISPMTVRQAMNTLVNQGLIYRRQGRGTFVAPEPMAHPLTRLSSFSEDMQARGIEPAAEILTFESIPATDEVASALRLPTGQEILHIKRLRSANGRAVGLHDAYLRILDITQDELRDAGSLYKLLETQGVQLAEGEEVIEAVAAIDKTAHLLNVAPGAPLLRVTRTTVDNAQQPVEFVIATYRADLYRYTIRLKR